MHAVIAATCMLVLTRNLIMKLSSMYMMTHAYGCVAVYAIRRSEQAMHTMTIAQYILVRCAWPKGVYCGENSTRKGVALPCIAVPNSLYTSCSCSPQFLQCSPYFHVDTCFVNMSWRNHSDNNSNTAFEILPTTAELAQNAQVTNLNRTHHIS